MLCEFNGFFLITQHFNITLCLDSNTQAVVKMELIIKKNEMKHFIFRVNRKKFESVNPVVTGKEVLEIATLLPVEDYELLIKVNEKGFEPVQLDEEIDLKGAGIEGFFAKPYKKLIIRVDDEPVEVDECFMTPDEILKESGKNPDGYYLKLIDKHKEISYKNDREHKVAIKNGLTFISCKLEATPVS